MVCVHQQERTAKNPEGRDEYDSVKTLQTMQFSGLEGEKDRVQTVRQFVFCCLH